MASKNLNESASKPLEVSSFHRYEVINVNEPNSSSPCIHVTIVQKREYFDLLWQITVYHSFI